MLWDNSVVMMDLETKSLWSHILGEAMSGPLLGTKLKVIPSLMTDWKTWRTIHPNTTLAFLDRTTREYTRSFYRDLSQFVIAMRNARESKVWAFDRLSKYPIVNDQFAREPLVIVFDQKSSTAFVLSRRVDDRVLTFKLSNEILIDNQTGSQWNAATGKAIQGQLKGKQLRPLVATVSFRQAWMRFHPNTIVWQRSQEH